MEIKELLVEGSTKKVYATDSADQVIIEFQDTLPPWLSKKKEKVPGKGAINNSISSYLFEYLNSYNVPTHFVRKLDERSFAARRLEMLPMSVHIWNIAGGDLAARFRLEPLQPLEYPIIEIYFKNPDLGNPMINEYHAYALGLCDRNEMTQITRIATKVNAVLKSYFQRHQLRLGDFRLEFGRTQNQILLADEISADTLTLFAVDEKGHITTPKKFTIAGSKKLEVYQCVLEHVVGNKA